MTGALVTRRELERALDGSSTTRYEYDHEGQRISKSGPDGTTQYYGRMLELRDAAGTALSLLIIHPGAPAS
jgi:YD repeat-containing protein